MTAAVRDLPISLCLRDPALAAIALTEPALEAAHAALRRSLAGGARRLALEVLLLEVLAGRRPPPWALGALEIPEAAIPAPPAPEDPEGSPSAARLARRSRGVRAAARAIRRAGRPDVAAALDEAIGRRVGREAASIPVIMSFEGYAAPDGSSQPHDGYGSGALVTIGLRIEAASGVAASDEGTPDDRRPLVDFAVGVIERVAPHVRRGARPAPGVRVEAGSGAAFARPADDARPAGAPDSPGAIWNLGGLASAALPILLGVRLLARHRAAIPATLLASGALIEGRLSPVHEVAAKIAVARRTGARVLLLHEANVREAAAAAGVSIRTWRPSRRGAELAVAHVDGIDLVGLPSAEARDLGPIMDQIVGALDPALVRPPRLWLRRIAVVAALVLLVLTALDWLDRYTTAQNAIEKVQLRDWLKDPHALREPPSSPILRLFVDRRLSLAWAYGARAKDLFNTLDDVPESERAGLLQLVDAHGMRALELCRELDEERGPFTFDIPPHVLYRRLSRAVLARIESRRLSPLEIKQLLDERHDRVRAYLDAAWRPSRTCLGEQAGADVCDGEHLLGAGFHEAARERFIEAEALWRRLDTEQELDANEWWWAIGATWGLARAEVLLGRTEAAEQAARRVVATIKSAWERPGFVHRDQRRDFGAVLACVEFLRRCETRAGDATRGVSLAARLADVGSAVDVSIRFTSVRGARLVLHSSDSSVEVTWAAGEPLAVDVGGAARRGGGALEVWRDGRRMARGAIFGPCVILEPDVRLDEIDGVTLRLFDADGREAPLDERRAE